jgi:ABC-type multidrug transport system fused ATPase/permease subunit
VQLFTAASFGVVAASALRSSTLLGALAGCLLTWPYYIFDRTRNYMLVTAVPAILILVFFRLRWPLLLRLVLLALFFAIVNIWLSFVIANRMDFNIAELFKQKGINLEQVESTHHEGLNMYEELCWMNLFISEGAYRPNWGYRYYTEIVNPIPRSIWPGKPYMGLDYSVLRGQANQGDSDEADVNATISTGMIGQGVANFGRILGPVCSAFLMSIWIALLARLDLTGHRFGHVLLFFVSLILTFNLGRDITLITLYTLIFGWILVWLGGRLVGGAPDDGALPSVVPLQRGRRRMSSRRRPTAQPADHGASREN